MPSLGCEPLCFLMGAAVVGEGPVTHHTQSAGDDAVSVTIIISPMFSLQSDRHRKLWVESPTGWLERPRSKATAR